MAGKTIDAFPDRDEQARLDRQLREAMSKPWSAGFNEIHKIAYGDRTLSNLNIDQWQIDLARKVWRRGS